MDRNGLPDAALLRDLVNSDQMTAEQVEHLLEDNLDFSAWYESQMQEVRADWHANAHLTSSPI